MIPIAAFVERFGESPVRQCKHAYDLNTRGLDRVVRLGRGQVSTQVLGTLSGGNWWTETLVRVTVGVLPRTPARPHGLCGHL